MAVDWSSSNSKVKINPQGVVTIGEDAVPASEVTITATSVYDSTVTGTCTLTIGGTAPE